MTTEEWTEADQRALEQAMQIARQDPDRAEQLDAKLQDEAWHDVAAFAAYICQNRSLRLAPWQMPPCWIVNCDDPNDPANVPHGAKDGDGRFEAARLCRVLRAQGISKWHPNPEATLADVRRRS